ncbi:XPB/Ssl2-like helicase family protein [Microterricola gilva]|uniref:XPB/Ssl2-like helicase family protein n=1 Tax=Microterricola gilva TaxID=393267 RepID=A0A4V2GAZ2_9MICO|nr:helicase-associated domain-containing protein [Microterricola gilva]RZU66156.1 XPB/Ssl2-like helicase family protein [Microterricola gilva]
MLALAARLRALTDEQLTAALGQREFPLVGVRDYFDLAEALLAPDSVRAALATLDRTRLAVLAVAGDLLAETDAAPDIAAITARICDLGHESIDVAVVRARVERLDELLLGTLSDGAGSGNGDSTGSDARFAPFEAVAELLRAWPEDGLPSSADLAAPSPHAADDDASSAAAADAAETREAVNRLAAERAFGTTSVVAELVTSLIGDPARELARGGLSLPDAKRLASDAAIAFEEVPRYLGLAERAGLVEREGALWQHSEAAELWLLGGTPQRWRTLAEAWHLGLAPDVRVLLAARAERPWGQFLTRDVRWIFPAAGDSLQQRIDDRTAEAELLGITAGGVPSTAGSALLEHGAEAAEAAVSELLPPEVSTVYLQHDLTAVAPGPLTPPIDARLRTMADVESREFASSYRITAASVNRALGAGESAEEILAFLSSISLSGVPQPLHYLVTESAERYGRLRVGPATDDGHFQGAIHSDDAALIHTVAVDHALSQLGLQQSGPNRLLSRFTPDVLFWALSDARYPVAAHDADGELVHLARRRVTHAEAPPVVDPLPALVATLRDSDADTEPTGQAWLARQIDLAIRSKHTLLVSVRMPGGEISDYLLEPASVANGRLRARDRRADIERTLPLSSIASVTTA